MKKIILLLLLATSLYSQDTINLSNDIIGEEQIRTAKSNLRDDSKPCIVIKWNVVLDQRIQNSVLGKASVLAAVDSVVSFYNNFDYTLVLTVNYLDYTRDSILFSDYGSTIYNVFNRFYDYKNSWGSDFDATTFIIGHSVQDFVGLAGSSSMCNYNNNLSTAVYWNTPWVQIAIIAHELGHNIGLPHIDQAVTDLMNPSLHDPSQLTFSQGSLDNLEFYRQLYKECLDTCSSLPLFTDDISSFSVDNICDNPLITKIELSDPYEEIQSSYYAINNDNLELIVVTKSGKVFTKSMRVSFNDCFVLYPNPTLNEFQIRTSKPIDKIQVFDIFSNEVTEWKIPGFYLVKIKSKNNTIIKSLIIK